MKRTDLHKTVRELNMNEDIDPPPFSAQEESLDLGGQRDESHEPHEKVLNFISKTQGVHLTPEEKAEGALAFRNFMKNHSHAKTPTERLASKAQGLYTAWIDDMKNLFETNPHYARTLAVLVLVFCFASTAVCATAQSSIPGELLYPVKVGVNERVERVLAVSTKAKAEVAIKQAVTRLEETKKLIEKKELNPETEKTIYVGLNRTSREVEESIAELKAQGEFDAAIKISAELESKLGANENDLNKILEQAPEAVKNDIGTTRVYVKNWINVAATQRAELEAKKQAFIKLMEEGKNKARTATVPAKYMPGNSQASTSTEIKAGTSSRNRLFLKTNWNISSSSSSSAVPIDPPVTISAIASTSASSTTNGIVGTTTATIKVPETVQIVIPVAPAPSVSIPVAIPKLGL